MLKVGITPKVRPRPKAQQAQQAQQAQPKAQSSSKPHPGSIPRCGFYFSVRASSVSRFLDQKSTASQPTGSERLLFPPGQSSKTSSQSKKITAPHTRAGVRGGCSPQNNLRKLQPY